MSEVLKTALSTMSIIILSPLAAFFIVESCSTPSNRSKCENLSEYLSKLEGSEELHIFREGVCRIKIGDQWLSYSEAEKRLNAITGAK